MPTIPGYNFEFVPTPLASGAGALFIDDRHGYSILAKTSNEAFQALWVEISFVKKKNICGVVYRQHNVFRNTLKKQSRSLLLWESRFAFSVILTSTF